MAVSSTRIVVNSRMLLVTPREPVKVQELDRCPWYGCAVAFNLRYGGEAAVVLMMRS